MSYAMSLRRYNDRAVIRRLVRDNRRVRIMARAYRDALRFTDGVAQIFSAIGKALVKAKDAVVKRIIGAYRKAVEFFSKHPEDTSAARNLAKAEKDLVKIEGQFKEADELVAKSEEFSRQAAEMAKQAEKMRTSARMARANNPAYLNRPLSSTVSKAPSGNDDLAYEAWMRKNASSVRPDGHIGGYFG